MNEKKTHIKLKKIGLKEVKENKNKKWIKPITLADHINKMLP
jgi:hypothetical protein